MKLRKILDPRIALLTALLVALAITCPSMSVRGAEDTVQGRRGQLKQALEAEWDYQLRTHPEMATEVGDDRYNNRLNDYSAAAAERDEQHARQAMRIFAAIDTTGFTDEEKLDRDLMLRQLHESIEQTSYKPWEMPEDQINGVHLNIASLPDDMPFRNQQDYENYLARLNQIATVFEQITVNMRAGMQDHLMPPRYLLEKAAAQAQNIANKPVNSSPFLEPAKHFPKSIPQPEQDRLRHAIEQAIQQHVAPAYGQLGAFLRDTYAPKGRTQEGIWALPDGAACYRFAVRQMTTTDLAPEQIHAMGLEQVKEIETEMLKVAQSEGFHDLHSFNQHIREDRQLYGTSAEQIFDLYRRYTDQMYGKLPQLVSHLPKAKLEVVPMSQFRAPEAVPADYSPGSGNGTRPGRINVNEYDPQHRLLLNVEAIAYHEGIPGHHLQFSIAQERTDLPAFRRFGNYNAYSEGWAFYAERLGREVGFYQDPYSEYGRLENEMWRSVRLVVDTGCHAKHWTRQQMIDYFREHTAMDEQNIETEVDRYIAWPGQALAYKVGQMKLLELRARAQETLGPRYSLRGFHDAVLAEGPLPLDVLESVINHWIHEQLAKPV